MNQLNVGLQIAARTEVGTASLAGERPLLVTRQMCFHGAAGREPASAHRTRRRLARVDAHVVLQPGERRELLPAFRANQSDPLVHLLVDDEVSLRRERALTFATGEFLLQDSFFTVVPAHVIRQVRLLGKRTDA